MSMKIRCVDHWHQASATAMAIVIDAYQEGDLTSTRTHTVRCMRYAFTTERVRKFMRLYKGNDIIFDWRNYGSQRARQKDGEPTPDPEPAA